MCLAIRRLSLNSGVALNMRDLNELLLKNIPIVIYNMMKACSFK